MQRRFAAVLGRTLAELVTTNTTQVDIGHFRVDRDAIVNARYPFWRDSRDTSDQSEAKL